MENLSSSGESDFGPVMTLISGPERCPMRAGHQGVNGGSPKPIAVDERPGQGSWPGAMGLSQWTSQAGEPSDHLEVRKQ